MLVTLDCYFPIMKYDMKCMHNIEPTVAVAFIFGWFPAYLQKKVNVTIFFRLQDILILNALFTVPLLSS